MPKDASPIPYQKLWRALDIIIALPLFVITLPAYAIIPLLHKCFSKENSIFTQMRIGKITDSCKNLVTVKKFCTMYGEKDQAHDPSKKGITPIGFLLRPIGLDEIPQISQIASGELSLFGPRPWSVNDYDVIQTKLGIDTTIERNRNVDPGILSPGGILLRYPHTPAEIRQRIAMDIRYSRKLSSPRLMDQTTARLSTVAILAIYGARMAWKARRE